MALQRPASDVPVVPANNGAASQEILPPPPAAVSPVTAPVAPVAPVAQAPAPDPTITVRIGQLGEKTKEISGPVGMTLGQALSLAELDPHNMTLRLQGEDVSDMSVRLENGDMITMRQRIRGGSVVYSIRIERVR